MSQWKLPDNILKAMFIIFFCEGGDCICKTKILLISELRLDLHITNLFINEKSSKNLWFVPITISTPTPRKTKLPAHICIHTCLEILCTDLDSSFAQRRKNQNHIQRFSMLKLITRRVQMAASPQVKSMSSCELTDQSCSGSRRSDARLCMDSCELF